MLGRTPVLTSDFVRVQEAIRSQVVRLNEALGLAGADHSAKVTYGYIGNDHDVAWYVFLPHPGRVGTQEDRLGYGHGWNDTEGARALLGRVSGALGLAAWAKGQGKLR